MNDKLTRNDIRKMEEEIEHRKLVIRKEALEAVKEARAQGDLSENFEYYAAKKYKNQKKSYATGPTAPAPGGETPPARRYNPRSRCAGTPPPREAFSSCDLCCMASPANTIVASSCGNSIESRAKSSTMADEIKN